MKKQLAPDQTAPLTDSRALAELDIVSEMGGASFDLSSAGVLFPGITLVICTYKRPSAVSALLDSIGNQTRQPDHLIIVDASPDTRTEEVVALNLQNSEHTSRTRYYRVSGKLRGLTRQRNFALDLVPTNLVAFLDDDVILEPQCLEMMARAMQDHADVVGVGAYDTLSTSRPNAKWRIRKKLGMVSSLEPGRYDRSGMSIPWGFLGESDSNVKGDWLGGFAMMWRSEVAKKLEFREIFEGYAQGEDLDFSLRARQSGDLMVIGKARVQHFHNQSGRPNYFELGFMEIYNRYRIQADNVSNHSALDVLRFVYSWVLDTLMLSRRLVRPAALHATLRQVAGRIVAAMTLLGERLWKSQTVSSVNGPSETDAS